MHKDWHFRHRDAILLQPKSVSYSRAVLTKGGLKSESRGVIFKLPKNVPKTILGMKKSKFQLFLHLPV